MQRISNTLKRLSKRVLALTLCAAMVISWLTYVEPTQAANEDVVIDYKELVAYKDLYIREADENTMDSYFQASLGGLGYLQWGLDGVSTATVRNNYGTRYAGEVWADKSVFALGQEVIAEIRPFEAGLKYLTNQVKTIYYYADGKWKIFGEDIPANDPRRAVPGIDRARQTLHYWLFNGMNITPRENLGETDTAGKTPGFSYAGLKIDGISNEYELVTALKEGTLTTAQANALNAAVNAAIKNQIENDIKTAKESGKEVDLSKYYVGDGSFDGRTLQLGRDTDGIKYEVTMNELSDFLHVFSTLGSSEVVNDSLTSPLDVVFVLDASGSMCDQDSQYVTGDTEHYIAYQDENGDYITVYRQADGTYKDENGVTVDKNLVEKSIHENANSRLEFAADALNQAFETLMNSSPYNRVALVTYNEGPQEVLSLGRYAPDTVDRYEMVGEKRVPKKEYSEGYRDGETRYFTIAKDGFPWGVFGEDRKLLPVTKTTTDAHSEYIIRKGYNTAGVEVEYYVTIGDTRFSESVQGFNQNKNVTTGNNSWPNPDDAKYKDNIITFYEDYASTTTENEWNIIEVNAVPEEGSIEKGLKGRIITEKKDKNTLYAGDAITYIPTYSNTDTQAALLYAMQEILAKESDTTVTLYYDKNGNPTKYKDNAVKTETVSRRPIVILLTDGRASMVSKYSDWWNSDSNNGKLVEGSNGGSGNVSLYIAATAALWKKVVNTNYYGSPVGGEAKDGSSLETGLYTFGLCLGDNDIIEMNPATWAMADGSAGLASMDGEYLTAYNAAQVYINYFRYEKDHTNVNNRTRLLNSLVTYINGMDEIQAKKGIAANEYPRSTYSTVLGKVNELKNSPSWGDAENTNLVDALKYSEILGYLAKIPAGPTFQTKSGKLEDGIFTPGGILNSDGTVSQNTGIAVSFDGVDYQPTTTDDASYFNFSNRFENVTVPERLPEIFDDLIKEILAGAAFTVLDGTNAAGIEDALTYSDPIGNYMTVDDVTYVTLLGHVYEVEKGLVDSVPMNSKYGLPVYVTSMANFSPTKRDNTEYTFYHIVADVTPNLKKDMSRIEIKNSGTPEYDPITGERLNWESSKRVNEGTGETFDLWNDIFIWVEDTGEWRDSTDSDFIVDNSYSEALYTIIGLNALPTQMVTVDLWYDKDLISTPVDYTTNLDTPEASTPLRVFYEVSMNKNYLRYAEGYNSSSENAKDYAVGVALSKLSPEYINANTGTEFTGHKGERYTAFYTNFFTDSIYDKYPVVSDISKDSRGNATLTFSPSLENQFYRFQKDRVLYLIPGTYGLEDRPAELNLGDLSDTYICFTIDGKLTHDGGTPVNRYDTGAVGKIVDKGTDGAVPLDPTYYKDLLAVLNKAREEAKSTYWAFGDCVPVNGSSNVKIDEDLYKERLKALSDEQKTETEKRKQTFKDNLNADKLAYQPQVDAGNWYYIIREFYFPVYGADGKVDHTEVLYMAIARLGSEFGSGLANGESMGAYVEWYNPNERTVSDTFSESKDAHYGHPLKGDDVINVDGDYHEHSDKWFVAAKPYGLRVGGLANFAGVKGYDIREGVGEGSFTKDSDTILKANVTETAKTFFLPTISSYGIDAEESAVALGDFIVNTYLGNNGRILVPDDTLVVTKQVNTAAGDDADIDMSEEFDFRIEIQGFFGERGAVIITQDEFAPDLWRRRFDSIDILTDYRSLLLGDDNNLALVDEDGRRVVRMEVVNQKGQTVKDDNGEIEYVYYYAKKDGAEVIKYATDDAEELKVTENGSSYKLVKIKNRELIEVDTSGTDYIDIVDDAENVKPWIRDDIKGIVVPDMTKKIDAGKVYYVYVGTNLRPSSETGFKDKTLRVFKAYVDQDENGHVTQDEEGSLTGLGDIYGNKSLRGGRTYYLNQDQYNALAEQGVTAGKTKETGFEFHEITAGDRTNGYQEGDREFWINKVILIRIDQLNTGWQTTISENYENYSNSKYDWRNGYTITAEDNSFINNLNGVDNADKTKYIIKDQFPVAHIRTDRDGGATTATTLSSNNGFYLDSAFLTTAVNFEVCTDHNHGTSYGYATIKLTDGQGLGFNNIDNSSHYVVTEILSPEQVGHSIRFEQAEHVQDNLLRTTYVYTEDPEVMVTTDDNVNNGRYVSYGAKIDENDWWYWDPGDLGTNVSIRESHLGDEYYWQEGIRVWNKDAQQVTADFSKAKTENPERRYTVVGTTSATEQAVHYVNFQPDITKVEFTPGEGESVYTGDYITYGIRWENFAYSAEQGKAQESQVIITDVLDPGVDFISAVFNPYHGNIMDSTDDNTIKFNGDDFEEEYKEMLELREEEKQLTARQTQLEDRKEELEDLIADLKDEINALQNNIDTFVPSEDPAEEEVGELADLKAVQAELADLEAALEAVKAELTDLEAREAEKQAKLAGLEAPKAEKQAELADLEAVQAALQAELSDLEVQKAALQAELSDLEAREAALQAELTDLETVQAELADLEAQKAEKQDKLSDVEAIEAEKQAKLDDLEVQKAALQDELTDLEAQEAALQAELDDLETQKAELSDLKAQKTALQAELSDLEAMQADLENLEAGQAVMQAELDDLEAEQDKPADLEAELADLEAELADLEANLETVKADLETVQTDLNNLENKWHDKLSNEPLTITLNSGTNNKDGDGNPYESRIYYESDIKKVSDLAEDGSNTKKMTVEIKYTPYESENPDDPRRTGGTVTWTITNAPASTYGYVELTVRVNALAMQEWSYDEDSNLFTGTWAPGPENNDNKVVNGASVQAGGVTRITDIILNPTGENTKSEVTPGNGMQVMESDELFYEIGWANSTGDTKNITIQDRLDPGVYFSKAWIMPSAGRADDVLDILGAAVSIDTAYTTHEAYVISRFEQTTIKPSEDIVEPGATEELGVTHEPGAAEEPGVSEESGAAQEPGTTEEPSVTEEPGATEEPGVTEEPGATKEPGVSQEPDATEEPGATKEPDVSQEPGVTEEPGASKEPDVFQEPAATEEPSVTEEPGATQEPTATQAPEESRAPDGDLGDKSTAESGRTDSDIQTTYSTDEGHVIAADNQTDTTDGRVILVIETGDETESNEGPAIAAGDETESKVGGYHWDKETVTLKSEPGSITLTSREDGVDKNVTVNVTIEYDPVSHTITWTLENVPAFNSGRVYFSVFVNEYADYVWKNRDEGDWKEDAEGNLPKPDVDKDDESEANEDDRLYNQARIGIPVVKNNETVWDWSYTNTVENPTHPAKDEVIPGNGKTVMVGQQITYTITWLNNAVGRVGEPDEGEPKAAKVTITDVLDPGVDFVKAGFVNEDGEYVDTLDEGVNECKAVNTTANGITTVTWTLPNRGPRDTGMVYLIVEVNEKAFENWNYVVDDSDPNPGNWTYEITAGEGQDDQVVNKARVTVDDGSDEFTNEVENPVTKPKKEEITPGDGKTVKVGKDIAYRITWKNYTYDKDGNAAAADVVVTDILDPGVTFVSASYGNVTLNAASDGSSVETKGSDIYGEITVSYNKGTHTVKWVLKSRVGETEGYVDLTVQVNREAFENWHYNDADGTIVEGTGGPGSEPQVVNKAGVKVGNYPTQYTEVVKNPVEDDPASTTTPTTTPNPTTTPTPNPTPTPRDVPKTGDESNLSLWLALLALCLSGLLAVVFYTVRNPRLPYPKDKGQK